MDEAELLSTLPTGSDVPVGWSLQDEPDSTEAYGEPVMVVTPEDAGVEDPGEDCQSASDALQEETDGVEYGAVSYADYQGGGGASLQVFAYSTSADADLAGAWNDLYDACGEAIGPGVVTGMPADPDSVELEDIDASMDGVAFIDDGAEGGMVFVAQESYGRNHVEVRGMSQDPRDLEAVEELIDRVKEKFEEGPSQADED